jgi:tetratricopeptide (TPR) repeat protein
MSRFKDIIRGMARKLSTSAEVPDHVNLDVEALTAQAKVALDRGALGQVDVLFERTMAASPSAAREFRADLAFKLGELYLKSVGENDVNRILLSQSESLVRLERSIHLFTEALNLTHSTAQSLDWARANVHLADAYFLRVGLSSKPKDYADAIPLLEKILKDLDRPGLLDAWLKPAQLLWTLHMTMAKAYSFFSSVETEQLSKAEELIRDALEKIDASNLHHLHPAKPKALHDLGRVLMEYESLEHGNDNEAITAFGSAILFYEEMGDVGKVEEIKKELGGHDLVFGGDAFAIAKTMTSAAHHASCRP